MPTKIPWTNETWNPIVGCSKVSEGCQNCSALQFAVRHAHNPKFPLDARIAYQSVIEKKNDKWNWNGKTALIESRLNYPVKWEKPRMIFLCFMGDLFHPDNSFEDIARVFEVVKKTPHHTYQILTKRPERMAEYFDVVQRVPENVWIGVTAENQEQADKRIPILLQIHAKVRFVSIEPMLSKTKLETRWFFPIPFDKDERSIISTKEAFENDLLKPLPGIDWVICGGETGHNARPMHPDWVRSLKDQCQAANVPLFFKQWGNWMPDSELNRELDNLVKKYPQVRLAKKHKLHDGTYTFFMSNKEAAGCKIDGKEQKQFPKVKSTQHV